MYFLPQTLRAILTAGTPCYSSRWYYSVLFLTMLLRVIPFADTPCYSSLWYSVLLRATPCYSSRRRSMLFLPLALHVIPPAGTPCYSSRLHSVLFLPLVFRAIPPAALRAFPGTLCYSSCRHSVLLLNLELRSIPPAGNPFYSSRHSVLLLKQVLSSHPLLLRDAPPTGSVYHFRSLRFVLTANYPFYFPRAGTPCYSAYSHSVLSCACSFVSSLLIQVTFVLIFNVIRSSIESTPGPPNKVFRVYYHNVLRLRAYQRNVPRSYFHDSYTDVG